MIANVARQMTSTAGKTTLGVLALALSSACLSAPASITEDGRYCFRDRRGVVRICTTHAVPDAQTDAQAHRFEGTDNALSVLVVRIGESDVGHPVALSVDGQPVAVTVPRALVRVQLAPGRHELTLQHGDHREAITVEGAAGEVRALLMRGQIHVSGERHWWEAVDLPAARQAADGARLIVDARLSP